VHRRHHVSDGESQSGMRGIHREDACHLPP
jgi:hypothetical protein